jgi:dTDP-4-dehydrorhamnose reductase
LTLRTSIIGRELKHHRSLLDWLLAQNGRQISGYTRALWSGVTTLHLSELVFDIATQYPHLSGLYQVVATPISKYDLLTRLANAFDMDVEIVPDDSYILDRTLDGTRLREAIGYVAPSWDSLIAQLVADPTPYSVWNHVP